MGISTSTGTLTAGQSRTFNLSPASAVTLNLSPNVRVTITETPATVAATGLGGNASRVHEPRLPGVVTYGPYPMGGSVLVEVESNSGSSVSWVRSDSIVAESADGAQSVVDGAGKDLNMGLFYPGADSVLSKFGKTAFDITLSNVTPASATNMTWSRTAERSRFGTETVKIAPSSDTGCIMHFASMSMTCDPVDLIYSIDVYLETIPPTYPTGSTPYITITLSQSAGLGSNYDQWIFDNSCLRQGWNTLKMWAGDDISGGYRGSNMGVGASRTKTGTGFDFTAAAQYIGIRFSYMNGYVMHFDQVRRAAKAKTKIVFGFDNTSTTSTDDVFTKSLAPMLKQYDVPSYFTFTWVYNMLASGPQNPVWNREIELFSKWGWDAINHTWNHGATTPGGYKTVTLSRTSNVVTATYASDHGVTIGQRFKALVQGATPSDMNGVFWMTSVTSTTVTYAATGTNGAGTGTINVNTLLSAVFTTVDAENQRLVNHEIADVSKLMKATGYGRGSHLLAWPNNETPDIEMTKIACAEGGVAFCRGGRSGFANVNEFGVDNPFQIGAFALESSSLLYSTQDMFKRKVAGAIGRGDCLFFFGHYILDETDPANIAHVNANLEYPPGRGGNPAPPVIAANPNGDGWWYLGQLRQFLVWLQPYRDSGQVEVIGFADFAKLNGYGVGK